MNNNEKIKKLNIASDFENIKTESEKFEQVDTKKIEKFDKSPKIVEKVSDIKDNDEMDYSLGAKDDSHDQEERIKKIEKVLEDDLEEIYLNLPPDKQAEFKKVGEETTKKINLLLNKTKVKVKEIISLIKKWLIIIPGVNRFFLEQEAKIKADEIMKMKS